MYNSNSRSLEGLVLYYPLIEIWSGTVCVRRDEDLQSAKDMLPPRSLVSDGRKRLVPKDPLNPLYSVRKAVERLFKGKGFRFMGGIAIPETEVAECEQEIPELDRKFHEGVDQMCGSLEHWYEAQERKYPAWEEMLRSSRLDEVCVRSRCRFHIGSCRVVAPDSNRAGAAAVRFDRLAGEALPQLLQDLALTSTKHLEKLGGRRCTQRSVAAARKLVDKLEAFSFLDPRVAPISDALNVQLHTIPTTGSLSPGQAVTIANLLAVIADPQRMLAVGENALDLLDDEIDETTADLFGSPAAQLPVAAPMATTVPEVSLAVGF